jgi:hypothetical protein
LQFPTESSFCFVFAGANTSLAPSGTPLCHVEQSEIQVGPGDDTQKAINGINHALKPMIVSRAR